MRVKEGERRRGPNRRPADLLSLRPRLRRLADRPRARWTTVTARAPRQPLTGDSHAHLLEPLRRLADELGFRVSYEMLSRVDGLCDHRARRITIDAALAVNAKVSMLVHELAHALIGRERAARKQLGKRLEELVV